MGRGEGDAAERDAGAQWHRAWGAALDALEVDVALVEALLGEDHRVRDFPVADPWKPPDGIGRLPMDLRPRADAILGRQLAASRAIAHAIATNRRQAAMLDRIEVGDQGAPRPVYLDYAV